jgi:hypothetical protein
MVVGNLAPASPARSTTTAQPPTGVNVFFGVRVIGYDQREIFRRWIEFIAICYSIMTTSRGFASQSADKKHSV